VRSARRGLRATKAQVGLGGKRNDATGGRTDGGLEEGTRTQ